LADQREAIKIEIGVREPTMTATHAGHARTLLLNPIRGAALIPEFPIASLSHQEATAEKLRAALCRPEVAIRDFFDIDHAICNAGLNALDPALVNLIKRKLAVDGTGPVNVSRQRREQLTAQLEAQLRPVLRPRDYERFDLNRAFDAVSRVADAVSGN
jgi:nucleotidyltransferase AbiEii toxin of type IV toxin-antitoxin system